MALLKRRTEISFRSSRFLVPLVLLLIATGRLLAGNLLRRSISFFWAIPGRETTRSCEPSEMSWPRPGGERAVFLLGDNVYPNGLVPAMHEKVGNGSHLERGASACPSRGSIGFRTRESRLGPGRRGGIGGGQTSGGVRGRSSRSGVCSPSGLSGSRGRRYRRLSPFNCARHPVVGSMPTRKVVQVVRREPGGCRGCIEGVAGQVRGRRVTKFLLLSADLGRPTRGKVHLEGPAFLRNYKTWLWMPLPILGSGYVYYRKSSLPVQDLESDLYSRMRTAIERASTPHPPAFFASGHDHGLQVLRGSGPVRYQLISGAGSKSLLTPVRKLEGRSSGSLALVTCASISDRERGCS